MVSTKQYDNLNRLTSITNSPGSSSAVGYSYAYNAANQRTTNTLADSSYWVYTYDSLGQVISGKKYWPDNTPVAGQHFEYLFDDIGNRRSAASGGGPFGDNLRYQHYSANSLNQYSTRTVPGYFNDLGTGNSNATVTLWAPDGSFATTSRKGTYFRGEFPLNNATGAVYLTLTNLAVLNNGTNADILTNWVGRTLIPQTPQSFVYDADGNQTSDGLWTNTWDAENRLLTMQSLSTVPDAAKQRLEFTYDWQGRRTQKIIYTWNGSNYVASITNRFVYDGWNLLATWDTASYASRSFMWGLDASGTMQGAGGVGGLLAVSDYYYAPVATLFVSYDGNYNVTALAAGWDGSVQAQYEYGPFGEPIRVTGAMASLNPFRFSSKYKDNETALVYYEDRYLDPSTGRWLSREPLGETVSRNPYGFVDNDGLNFFDLNGLQKGAQGLINNPNPAFPGMQINPLSGAQLLLGLPFSVLSGDIFHSDIQEIPNDTCNVLITVNGIFTPRDNALRMMTNVSLSARYAGAYGLAAGNRTTYAGDLLQIIGDEFGAIQSSSFDLARQINDTYEAFKQNNCCCGKIQIFAHSQGTKIFQRAEPLIRTEAKKLICYTGIGGETRIASTGLANAENYRNIYDPVPYAQFLNPLNWPTQPFIDTSTRQASGHNYFSSYEAWVQQLKPNCPCTTVSK